MKNKRFFRLAASMVILSAIGISIYFIQLHYQPKDVVGFDGNRALLDVVAQVNFGPRIPGSMAHKEVINYILHELDITGWTSQILEEQINGHIAYNILATRSNENPSLLLGAHYDSRILADNDPVLSNRQLPVPGAIDGASGVAVLLELARTLPKKSISTAFLFIDIEDNGNIPGWDWLLGSRAFASHMAIQPKAVIILDMIGDKDLNIYKEQNSDPELTNQLWAMAGSLGYANAFIPEYKYRVLDDHIPFIEKNIRAVDVIDLDYSYWHTTMDTADKVSAKSLQIVGDTLIAWIAKYGPCLNQVKCN